MYQVFDQAKHDGATKALLIITKNYLDEVKATLQPKDLVNVGNKHVKDLLNAYARASMVLVLGTGDPEEALDFYISCCQDQLQRLDPIYQEFWTHN